MEIINELKCPECGVKEFQLGPRGGVSINIRCRCGQKLNVCHLPDGQWWYEKIGKDAIPTK